MKRFTCKRLIPSLAASAMVAAATLAPLPGFLAAGSMVHADPVSPLGLIRIERAATFINVAQVNVDVEYICSPVSNLGSTDTNGNITVTLTQPTGSGTGSVGSTLTGTVGFVVCDNHWHEATVQVFGPNFTTPSFTAGKACATATLRGTGVSTGPKLAQSTRDIFIDGIV